MVTAIKQTGKRRARDLALVMGVAGISALIISGLFRTAATRTAKEDIREVAERAAAQYRDMISRVEGALVAARDYGVDPAEMVWDPSNAFLREIQSMPARLR